MQIISNGDNWHEMSNPFFWENKKNIVPLSSAELAKRVVKVKWKKKKKKVCNIHVILRNGYTFKGVNSVKTGVALS